MGTVEENGGMRVYMRFHTCESVFYYGAENSEKAFFARELNFLLTQTQEILLTQFSRNLTATYFECFVFFLTSYSICFFSNLFD